MPAVPIKSAVAALGISESTLRRKIADGAPVARAGRRGRGGAILIDLDAWRAWDSGSAGPAADSAGLRILAAELPDIIGKAIAGAFDDAVERKAATGRGFPAADVAFVLAGAGYDVIAAVRDHLAKSIPDLAEDIPIPASIERLRKIATR